MSLSMKQLESAQLMARGVIDKDVWPKVGIGQTTLYRWKKLKTFQDCLFFFQKEEADKAAAIAAAAGNPDDLEQSRIDELEVRAQIKELAINSCTLANKLIQNTLELNAEDISPRMIPNLVRAATDAIACLREGNDRLTGLEGILDELGKIEKEIQIRSIEVSHAQESRAA